MRIGRWNVMIKRKYLYPADEEMENPCVRNIKKYIPNNSSNKTIRKEMIK